MASSVMTSMLSMKFFDQIVHMNDMEEDALKEALMPYLKKKKVSDIRKKSASKRRFRQRRSWATFQASLTDRQFRRYFRMSRDCFQYLCDKIEANVGERTFKSECFLSDLKTSSESWNKYSVNLMQAHEASTGGFVSGEVKLALTLRLLAGGSYLDLALLYEVSSSSAYIRPVCLSIHRHGLSWPYWTSSLNVCSFHFDVVLFANLEEHAQ